MLGYSRQEIAKISFVDITHPDDREETQRLSMAVRDRKTNFYRTEKRYSKKNGDVVWVIVQVTAIRNNDGSIKYWLGLMEDITEHKKAKEALAESEKKYRSILEGIAEGYFEVDLTGNFTFFNEAMHKILGFTLEELLGTNNREYTSKETAQKIFRVFNRVYHTGRPARVLNYEITTKGGSKKVLEVTTSLMRDSNHKPIGFRGLAIDVTEHLVVEREKERMVAQIQQTQKMEAIGTLAG
jgi:PAS domain S-box-containing protein